MGSPALANEFKAVRNNFNRGRVQVSENHFANKSGQFLKPIKNEYDCEPIPGKTGLFDTLLQRESKRGNGLDLIGIPGRQKGQVELILASLLTKQENEQSIDRYFHQKYGHAKNDYLQARLIKQYQLIRFEQPTLIYNLQGTGGTTAPPEINIFIPSPTETSIR